jgi:succinyl-diaminopimelate desuccinylase
VTDPVELAQKLINCASVTPEDDGAQQALINSLELLGFECHSLPFGNIKNLFARIGDNAPHICFCGHTDVVPVGNKEDWSFPPFDAVIKEDKLYGRGTVDMKGAIAAFVCAASQYLENNELPGSISLLITGDEEADAVDGTIKVLPWMKEHGHIPDLFLVGEPTNPENLGEEIKIGRRGSMSGTITVTGKQGHAAYPQLADNPVPVIAKMVDALSSFEFDQGTDYFQPTNIEVTSIDVGNSAANVIPAKAIALFNIRFNDLWNAPKVEEKIREILNDVSNDYELKCASNAESFITKPGKFSDFIADAVESATGKKPALTTNGGTSDARFCINYAPVVECGLINKTAHHVDEFTTIDDLHNLTGIYKKVLEMFFNL